VGESLSEQVAGWVLDRCFGPVDDERADHY
jgi:hypothetical protein